MSFNRQPVAYITVVAIVAIVIIGMFREMSVGEIVGFAAVVTGAGGLAWTQVTPVAAPRDNDGAVLVPQDRRLRL